MRFRDPFRDTLGIEPFRELFVRMFKQYRLVDFTDVVAEGDESAFTLRYNMHLRMAVGPTFVTPMASVFRARDGKVCANSTTTTTFHRASCRRFHCWQAPTRDW